nr:lipopolysaccharide biosynthesis protein [uncultured Methylotenera sp.]
MSLSKKTITGVIWNFCEQLGRRAISLLVTLLLAYFLAPEDFGLLAMMALFLALATNMMDSGVKEALVRLPDVSDLDLSSAFFLNLGLGFIAYITLYFAAPWIADFYHEPRLTALLQVSGLVVVINAFQVIQIVIMTRSLDFKSQVKITLPASMVSGLIAIAMGYFGMGVWALIGQMISSALLITIFLWFKSTWRPRFSVSYLFFLEILNFGYKLFISGVLSILAKNIFAAVIAKLYSTTTAGLYYLSERMLDVLMGQLVYAIQNVTYPVLSSIQDDTSRLKLAYRRILGISVFIIFPTILIAAALAEPLFKLFFSAKWWAASSYFQIMCLGFVLYPLHAINLNILKVKGRSDLFLKLEVIKVSISILILAMTLSQGVKAILLGQVLSSFIAYFCNSYYSIKLINYSLVEQFLDFSPSFILAALIALMIYFSQGWVHWNYLIEVILFAALGAASYLAFAYYLKLNAFSDFKVFILTSMKRE